MSFHHNSCYLILFTSHLYLTKNNQYNLYISGEFSCTCIVRFAMSFSISTTSTAQDWCCLSRLRTQRCLSDNSLLQQQK